MNGPSRAYMITVGVIGVVIVALIVLLVTGGKSSNDPTGTSGTATTHSAVVALQGPHWHSTPPRRLAHRLSSRCR